MGAVGRVWSGLGLALAAWMWCGTAPAVWAQDASPAFRDATPGSGIRFVHSNGATGTKQYKEVVGSGVCLLDADGDGLLDLYLVNCAGPNRLYRNLGELRFEDVTGAAGVADAEGWGMGAVAADFDGDGDDDLFVTNVGPNRLFRNRGNATFEEIGAAAGVDDARWGAGAAFLDADGDDRLDLFVANYVQQAEPDTNHCFGVRGTLPLYCHPRMYPAEEDIFYRNRGDGTFEDATASGGFSGHAGRGLGVTAADVDDDGFVDLYVANDLDPNFLYRNLGDGTFEEIATISGCGYNEDGREESGMGIAIEDYDGTGTMDILVTNFQNESNTLYRQEEGGFFFDESAPSGLGAPSLPRLAWGTHFFDADLDGWLDLYVANGHTESDIELVDQLATWKQPDQWFRNLGDGTFQEVAVPALEVPRVGRGAAFGDLDGDGDTDVILNNQNGPATLLENTARAAWIGLDVRQDSGNTRGVGWRVVARTEDGREFTREFRAGGSYLSGNDPRIVLGLGDTPSPVTVTLRRGPGRETVLGPLAPNRYHVLSVTP